MVPDPPDIIDLSGGGAAWPAFVLSGATSATGVNSTYTLRPYDSLQYEFEGASGAMITGNPGEWQIEGSNAIPYFDGDGTWPWSSAWSPTGGAGGTLAFVRALAAPVSTDLGGASEIPEVLVITGITDPADGDPLIVPRIADVNGYPQWEDSNVTVFWSSELGWYIAGSSLFVYDAIKASEAPTPVGLTGWTINDGDGQPVIAGRQAAPDTITLEGAAATVQATMTTSQIGANNDLAFTAVPRGRLGNEILIIYSDPSANNASLSVSVTGRTITMHLATGAGGAITTTAAQIKAAIEASPAASALVTVVNAPGSNGSGIVTADYQDLADGAGGLPPAPVTIAI